MCRSPIFCILVVCSACAVWAAPPDEEDKSVRKLHFIQDDAQDYMVSKLYELKYAQANDLVPFVQGMIMRYNTNSSAGSITYGTNNSQMLAVTCPVKMMPYVDDFIRLVDRPVKLDGKIPGEIIQGTGITRAVYRPKYRSGENILNVLVNSVIGEGPWSSVYAWDKNSNQIYWKDNSSNTAYVYQFLAYLDRPAPQIHFTFKLYETRESDLHDMGLEYLAWKNGPGMNIFQTAFQSFSISSGGSAALQAMSGPLGGFFAAPQFDASFIRLLAQSGKAHLRNTASLTCTNSDSAAYSISFSPQLQNIIKKDSDKTFVTTGTVAEQPAQIALTITGPVVNLHYGQPQQGYPKTEAFEVDPYTPGEYNKYAGTVFFACNLVAASVVERDNIGDELVETTETSSNMLMELNREVILARWDKTQTVEQVVGIPFLCRIPYLRYLFGTVTRQTEKTRMYVTVTATMLNTAAPEKVQLASGELKRIK